jgi:AraC-like DNA-binding protein
MTCHRFKKIPKIMGDHILKEVTTLTQNDCMAVFFRSKKQFDFPLHYHPEYELNLILNAKNAQRVIGDHLGILDSIELTLVGPNTVHGWFKHECTNKKIDEITILWHNDLLNEKFLMRSYMNRISCMLSQSSKGILFSNDVAIRNKERIIGLVKKEGFDSVHELMSILHDLSLSADFTTLSATVSHQEAHDYNSRRIQIIMEYLHANYSRHISLSEAAGLIHMTEIAFCRYIRRKTGYTFIENLNNIRIGHAAKLLIDTTESIAEIAYKTGFNNLSNFNRIFKKKKNYTPKEFRANYTLAGVQVVA